MAKPRRSIGFLNFELQVRTPGPMTVLDPRTKPLRQGPDLTSGRELEAVKAQMVIVDHVGAPAAIAAMLPAVQDCRGQRFSSEA
jgi:hypothetical protein